MNKNFNKEEAYFRAKKKVDNLKGFYWHLISYLLVNTMISFLIISSMLKNGYTFSTALFSFNNLSVWIFWGIGLVIHALVVFKPFQLFTKDWENRQIEKYMQQEEEQENKFKNLH